MKQIKGYRIGDVIPQNSKFITAQKENNEIEKALDDRYQDVYCQHGSNEFYKDYVFYFEVDVLTERRLD